jgi:hypothetical protein
VTAPSGLGWYVAFESEASKVTTYRDPVTEKAADLATLIDRAVATGATWIAPRASAGGRDDPALFLQDGSVNETSLRAYKDAGLKVYPWIFAYKNTTRGELVDWAALAKTGLCDGAIINAEFEYIGTPASEASSLVRSVRDAGFDWVAHAPPDYLGSGGGEPWKTLNAECNAIQPQVYAHEHDDKGHLFHLQRVLARYSSRSVPMSKVQPIFCSYRPKVRGFSAKDGKPLPTPPMANEAEWVANDLIAVLDSQLVQDLTAPSVYSLDAITFINGPSDQVIQKMTERAIRIRLIGRTVRSPAHEGSVVIPDLSSGPGEQDPTD